MQALVLTLQGNQNIHRLLIYCSYALHEFSKALKSLAIAFSPAFNDKLANKLSDAVLYLD